MRPPHVYIHIPFCARRCSYCDFAIAVRQRVPVQEYLAALAAELALRYPAGEPWIVDTLYLGGGTPSLLGGEGVAALLQTLHGHLSLSPAAEVTLEANPDDVSTEAIARWRDAGVNRLSLGAQTFDDRVLEWMHRTHSADQIAKAVTRARAGGISNLSFDLIFAIPPALGRVWEADLERALALEPDHLSLYGLTLEPATPLARWRDRGELSEVPDELYEHEYILAHDRLGRSGYEHYEVSSFARPGKRSRHNCIYWSGSSYAGLGPSAHEFDGTERRWNARAYADWMRSLLEGRDPVEGRTGGSEKLSEENRWAERVYLGLRTEGGLTLTPAEADRVRPWVQAGWGVVEGGRFRATATGWLRLDALAADLTALGSRS